MPKPNKKIQLISALLTYGTRYSANTVPGTIIKKIICKQFAISIRWGEDLVWMENYKNYYNSKPQYECSYSFFKNSISETYKKYIKQIQDALKNKSTYRKIYICKILIYSWALFISNNIRPNKRL